VSKPSLDQWREISPLLDEALALPDDQREAWLQSLTASKPQLIGLLRGLLEEHRALSREHFLEWSPSVPEGGAFLHGRTVGPYTLISPIGQGGMGRVWLAERSDGRFERRVAIKFLQFSVATRGGAERFRREGRILGSLVHPHIAELIDAGVMPDGQPYMVLEYVEGEPIDQYCDTRSLSVNARIRLFLDVLGALAHAHSNLIVHRDIKPSNVLVSKDGQVKLLDFGIAKLLGYEEAPLGATPLTLEVGTPLTPRFAAPEQLTGGPITTTTDIYALGILLFELLTGHHPVGRATQSTAEVVKAIVETEPPRVSEAVDAGDEETARQHGTSPEKLQRALRGDLDLIVSKALKKNPVERYASVSALGDDLHRYLIHEPISARPDAASYRLRKYVRRHPLGVGMAAALVILLTGFFVVQTVELRRISHERDRADRIAQFMTDMFRAPDPNESRGDQITAREILDRGTRQMDAEISNDPQLEAELKAVMGATYSRLGVFSAAQPLLENAISIGKRVNGAGDRGVLRSEDELALLLIQQGQLDRADQLLQESLSEAKRSLGEKAPITLHAMSDLAYALLLRGRKEQALSLARLAFETSRRVEGEGTIGTLWSMNVLALILGQTGHLPESEAMYTSELAIELRVHGQESVGALNAMSNLGATLVLMGRLSEAEDVLKRILPIQEQLDSSDHPEVGRTLYNLACIAARRGRRNEAFSFLQQSIPIVYVRTLKSMEGDSDLAALRGDSRWSAVAKAAKKRIAEAEKSK
jgi:eukaryotic-like serine/threonine-protein kinase